MGLLLGKLITRNASTAYVDNYSVFSPADTWSGNLSLFPKHWISMFAILPEDEVPFFSGVGIKLFIRICTALFVLAATVRSFWKYKSISSRIERVFICIHWTICAEILFFFIFGVISNMNWRIIPMFLTGIICAFILLKNDFSNYGMQKPFDQLLDIASAVFILLYGAICSLTVFHQPISTDFWNEQGTILKELADHGLTYGYNLDYWFANSITVLTDERFKVREVVLRDGELAPANHQSNIHWYEDQPGVEKYFFVCQEDEFWAHPEFADGAIETYRATQERTFIKGTAGFFIFVYDRNIF